MWVCVGSSVMDPAVRSLCFCRVDKMVVNGTGLGIGADKSFDGQMVESVVSLAIVCQFLCMVAVNSLPVSEKGVTMGRMLVSDCGVHWDNR